MAHDDSQFWSKLGVDSGASGSEKLGGGRGMELLSEAEVTFERLQQLFDAAYLEYDVDDDGDLRVATDAGPSVFVTIQDGPKMIRLTALYRFRDDSGEDARLQFANRLNDDMILVRFSASENDTLIADYYLPYARGVLPFHIINALKMMGRIIISGLRQHDADNLIE